MTTGLKKTGFTLMEVLVSLGIVGILIAAVYGSLGVVARSSMTLQWRLDGRMDAQIAMDQICASIRSARTITINGLQLDLVTSSPIVSPGQIGLYSATFYLDNHTGILSVCENPVGQPSALRWCGLLRGVRSIRWIDELVGSGRMIRISIVVEDGPGELHELQRTVRIVCKGQFHGA